jgi:hypothetical protein
MPLRLRLTAVLEYRAIAQASARVVPRSRNDATEWPAARERRAPPWWIESCCPNIPTSRRLDLPEHVNCDIEEILQGAVFERVGGSQ